MSAMSVLSLFDLGNTALTSVLPDQVSIQQLPLVSRMVGDGVVGTGVVGFGVGTGSSVGVDDEGPAVGSGVGFSSSSP